MSASSTETRRGLSGFSPQTCRGLFLFLAALSGSSAFGIDVLLPGLSDIRSALDLPADSTQVSLLITAYLFGIGTGWVLYGPLADHYGRKPVVIIGLGLFAAGAVGSALSLTNAVDDPVRRDARSRSAAPADVR
jgi:MFS family permease